MTNLNQALVDIRDLRRQVARTTQFRGYGPLTLSATALLALVTGMLQAQYVPRPAAHPAQYVALWLATGFVCAAVIATEMLTRTQRLHSGMADAMIRMAVAHFLPAAIAGVALPFVLLRVSPGAVWMMPGLWQIIFSLGVFASCCSLPGPMILAGIWFLLSGLGCLAVGTAHSLAPAMMADSYAGGMTLVAVIQYRSARSFRSDDEKDC